MMRMCMGTVSHALLSVLYHATDRQRTSRHESRGRGGSERCALPKPKGREEGEATPGVVGGEGAGESCSSTCHRVSGQG